MLAGGTAASALLPLSEGITRLRGRWFDLAVPGLEAPVPTLPMFHPSFLLRAPERKQRCGADLLWLCLAKLDAPVFFCLPGYAAGGMRCAFPPYISNFAAP